ncbi:MAG TPA: helix-turn-helix domain-containing protein [Polyangiaceae bacterium]|nr:helix-turn-helix domain-containing protein [Polyangiaceae bacterium]
MRRKSLCELECPIARSLDLVGEAWTLLILRDALLGATRFQDFQERLGMPPSTLSRRLEQLTEQGLLERSVYEEKPVRERYQLTEKGADLAPVLLALSAWGNRWLAPDGPPLECVDPETGVLVEPVVVDRRTKRELSAGRVALRAGGGASRELKRKLPTQVLFGRASEVAP